MSLAALLAGIADESHRQALWRSETEASLIDAQRADAQIETRDWETTLWDGID